MRRIAFIGIENADDTALHAALRRNLNDDEVEITAFGKDVEAVSVAPFLVSKNKETGALDGSRSVAYISESASESMVKKISRLAKAGVVVRTGWTDYETDASDEEIEHWIQNGSWPEPEPEPEDDVDDLLALMDEDDEDEDAEEETPAPVAPQPEEAVDTTPVDDEDEDEPEIVLPTRRSMRENVAEEPVEEEQDEEPQEGTYRSHRFDSMGANDVALPSPVDEDDDEGDDLPLPSFMDQEETPAPVEEPEPEYSSYAAEQEDDEDGDELPVFAPTASVQDEEEDSFATDVEEWGGVEDSSDSDDDDDDLELPSWVPEAASEPEKPRQEAVAPAQEDEDDEEDDLPRFNADAFEQEFWGNNDTPQEETAAPVEDVVDDEEDDDLPMFNPGDDFTPVDNTPEPSADVEDDEDGDDLPAFTPQQEPAPVTRRSRKQMLEEAEAAHRQSSVATVTESDEDEEDDDLPMFSPNFASNTAEPEEAPVRRRARPQPEPVQDEDENEDGDDLPVFSPEFAPKNVEPEEEPIRRRARRQEPEPAQDEEEDGDGDDLPEFISREAPKKQAARVEHVEDDEDDVEEFSFAPKVHTPSYAAPDAEVPEWGRPVQRQPVTKQTERKKRAPEKVRYDKDVPSEVAAEQSRRTREDEGYEQPEIERDVQDRELKPSPVETGERRRSRRVVNQRPAAPVEDDNDLDDIIPAPKRRSRPVIEPEPVEEESPVVEDDFDPDAEPPYMQDLDPERRRAQTSMEQIRRDYDADSILRTRSKNQAVTTYITGSHGGAGKTTSAWMLANTVAGALKKDPERPVFLIEGDYENSKLAQRLNLPPEKNSGKLAEFFRRLGSDRSLISKQKINMMEVTQKIIEESIYVNEYGVNIIAAPYDLTKRDGRFLRMAIQKSVEYAERQGGYVFIDADTLSNDDVLDRTLAAKATHVIVVSFGDQDHVDDTYRAIHTLTTPNIKAVGHNPSTNGMGVPKDRIKLFFNKTGSERFTDLQQHMLPYLVEGHLPTVQGLNDGGWIGNLTGGDFLNSVTSYASFFNHISPMEELRPYEQRRPQKSTQRGGFMKIFSRR